MRLAVLLFLTCGCRQILGLDTPDPLRADAGADDAASNDVSPDAGLCFSRPALNLGACLAAPPTSALMAPVSTSIDTDDSTFCAPLSSSTQDMCVVAATSISVSSSAVIRIIGKRPLVLFSSTLIALAGTFDVASHGGGLGNLVPSAGAGEDPSVCGSVVAPTTEGGGAGGSFGTRGGDGGRGATVLSTPGQPAPALSVDAFHGGCRGGVGADGGGGGPAFGGGAIALFATTVAIDGTINASGMGGPGAPTTSKGGYGGGSGGMIVISAPSVTLATQGQMFANGGAGGGGSSNSIAGANGGEATAFNTPINGGQGGNNGDGGSAYPTVGNGQDGAGNAGGGGGGGGGAGAIAMFTDSMFASPRISPAPVLQGF